MEDVLGQVQRLSLGMHLLACPKELDRRLAILVVIRAHIALEIEVSANDD